MKVWISVFSFYCYSRS